LAKTGALEKPKRAGSRSAAVNATASAGDTALPLPPLPLPPLLPLPLLLLPWRPQS
jgi:hypothetical protein